MGNLFCELMYSNSSLLSFLTNFKRLLKKFMAACLSECVFVFIASVFNGIKGRFLLMAIDTPSFIIKQPFVSIRCLDC